MAERYQVIIAGGGPVGVAMAVDLGLRGIDCLVVGRHLEPQQLPKGQNLTQRTLEHFYLWGVVDELRRARIMPKGYPIGGVTAYGDLMSEYWYAPVRRGVVRSFYYEDSERLPQYLTEEVLRKRAAELTNVTTLYGWTAEEIQQDGHGVRVAISETEGAAQPGGRYEWAGFLESAHPSHSPAQSATSGAKRVWRPNTSSVATGPARPSVSRWVSVEGAQTSTKRWCWPSSGLKSCTRLSGDSRKARPTACSTRI